MKVLVTGGMGFIGSHLVDALVEKAHDVTVLDDMSHPAIEKLQGINDFSKTPVECISSTNDHNRFDVIYHLAAKNIIASTKSPYSDFTSNAQGTFSVLDYARRYDVKRVIYTSSASIYGNSSQLPITEDTPAYMLTPYAASKYTGELYCQAFYESFRLPVVVFRLSNVYGPRQRVGVIPIFMQAVRESKSITVCGDGQQTRDYTYVDDVVRALMWSIDNERAVGETMNIGTGIETNVNQLARMIYCKHGDSDFIRVENRDIDNVRRRVMSIERARRVLRWTPTVTLRDGLQLTWDSRNKV